MLLRGFVLLILLVGASPGALAETPLEITKTSSKQKLNIEEEVVAFYRALIKNNPEVSAIHTRLIGALESDGGRPPFATEEIYPVCWRKDFDVEPGSSERPFISRKHASTYLVFQNILEPAHHSYTTKRTAVAMFKVTFVNIVRPNDYFNDEDRTATESNTLTMKFEGFVDVTMRPIK